MLLHFYSTSTYISLLAAKSLQYKFSINSLSSYDPSYILSHKSIMSALAAARYGKDNVRVYKVHRDEKTGVQTVVEMTVCVLLEGDIETS